MTTEPNMLIATLMIAGLIIGLCITGALYSRADGKLKKCRQVRDEGRADYEQRIRQVVDKLDRANGERDHAFSLAQDQNRQITELNTAVDDADTAQRQTEQLLGGQIQTEREYSALVSRRLKEKRQELKAARESETWAKFARDQAIENSDDLASDVKDLKDERDGYREEVERHQNLVLSLRSQLAAAEQKTYADDIEGRVSRLEQLAGGLQQMSKIHTSIIGDSLKENNDGS